MHRDTCVTHGPWCISGSLARGSGGSVPGIPGACTTSNFAYLVRGPWHSLLQHFFKCCCSNFCIDIIWLTLEMVLKCDITLNSTICVRHLVVPNKQRHANVGCSTFKFNCLFLRVTWKSCKSEVFYLFTAGYVDGKKVDNIEYKKQNVMTTIYDYS